MVVVVLNQTINAVEKNTAEVKRYFETVKLILI